METERDYGAGLGDEACLEVRCEEDVSEFGETYVRRRWYMFICVVYPHSNRHTVHRHTACLEVQIIQRVKLDVAWGEVCVRNRRELEI